MAEGKKSFVLYVDLIHTVEKLPDDKAGQLLKHILDYVNDKNPETDDLIIQLSFEPIKQQLKRDLKKWDEEKQNKSNAGSIGNLKRWHPDLYKLYQEGKKSLNELQTIAKSRSAIQSVAEIAVNDNVNVSVNVSDNVNEIKETKDVFNFRKSLIELGIKEKIVSDWLKVRSKKKAANTDTAFKGLKTQIKKSGLSANECIKLAVESSWSGFKADWVIIGSINSKFKKSEQEIDERNPNRLRI